MRQPILVGRQKDGVVFLVEDQLHALLDAGLVNLLLCTAQLVQIDGFVVEFEGPCLDFRDVEDVVYQLQEQFGVRVDDLGELLLLLLGFDLGEQFREADDGVERRADFMAHIGKERRFETVRRLGFRPGFDQLQLGLFHFGDVPRKADDQRQTVFGGNQRLGRRYDPPCACGRGVLLLKFDALSDAEQVEIVAAEFFGVLRIGEKFIIGTPERFRSRNAGVFLKGFVPVKVPEFVAGVFDEEADGDVIQNGLHQ